MSRIRLHSYVELPGANAHAEVLQKAPGNEAAIPIVFVARYIALVHHQWTGQ
jgi:hypothetical protein